MLILTAMIWGLSFVAQKSGLDYIGPLAFNGLRTVIGGITLIPVIILLDRHKRNRRKTEGSAADADAVSLREKHTANKQERKTLITGGICCGCALLVASNIQQIGLIYTTAGKSGFITAMYVVLVPILGLFLGRRIRPVIWLCVIASAAGLYLLCIPAGGGFGQINTGDIMTSGAALVFAIHIMIIDHFSPRVDGVKLSCLQFFVAGSLSLALIWLDPLLGFELPSLHTLTAAWLPLLYSGVLSCGAAYTMQVVAQAKTDPAIASMIMCLESVFAVISGMIILGESMAMREVIGCLIMFAAIVVSQLPAKNAEPTLK